MSEPFYQHLPPDLQQAFSLTEPMAFKHVSQVIATYRFDVPAEMVTDRDMLSVTSD